MVLQFHALMLPKPACNWASPRPPTSSASMTVMRRTWAHLSGSGRPTGNPTPPPRAWAAKGPEAHESNGLSMTCTKDSQERLVPVEHGTKEPCLKTGTEAVKLSELRRWDRERRAAGSFQSVVLSLNFSSPR